MRKNSPYITIEKVNGPKKFKRILYNEKPHHIDRIVEKLSKFNSGKTLIGYEVIWKGKVHHEGFIVYREGINYNDVFLDKVLMSKLHLLPKLFKKCI